MIFFNKKEDVMDIQLTQFGKDLLARGYFKPVYYQFFDDDIIYNIDKSGAKESQNSAETRILKKTPKLKTQHIAYSIEQNFDLETEKIVKGEMEIFRTIVRNADPSVQDRVLLYPLHEFNIASEDAPTLSLRSHGKKFEQGVQQLELQNSGINKNIPQITIKPSYFIKEERGDKTEPEMVDEESHFDLMGRTITFADNTRIQVEAEELLIDLEELNSFYGLDNFELQVFEVIETDGKDDTLKRLTTKEEIDQYFHIKTDEDVEEVKIQTGRSRNYYKRGES